MDRRTLRLHLAPSPTPPGRVGGDRLLVVEDDRIVRTLLSESPRREGFEVVAVARPREALALLNGPAAEEFDLVLLDWVMPEMNGLEVLAEIRRTHSPNRLPVIMVTARADTEDVVTALERGANDYVTKPVQLEVALARIRTHLTLKRGEERLRRAAVLDPLTGLFNRRHLMERLEASVLSARRYRHPLSCCLWDLDHYKEVNDRHGHRVGDEVLVFVGALLREEVRCTDYPARYGGDEFVVVFPHTDAEGARTIAERIRQRLEQMRFTGAGGQTFAVTGTFGIAALDPAQDGALELLEAADQALYRAKAAGRNRVVVAGELSAVPPCATAGGAR